MWLQFITGEYKKSSILLNACFSFCNRSQAYFLLFLESRDKPKVLQTNLYCLLEVCVLTNLFPNCRSVILKECDTVKSTSNLSTWRLLTNQSMIPESGIMERWHLRHVSRLRCPFALPRLLLGSLRSQIFSLFDPVPFCLSAEPGPKLSCLIQDH